MPRSSLALALALALALRSTQTGGGIEKPLSTPKPPPCPGAFALVREIRRIIVSVCVLSVSTHASERAESSVRC